MIFLICRYNSAKLPASLKPEDVSITPVKRYILTESPDASLLQRWLPQVNPVNLLSLYNFFRDPTTGRFDLTKASVKVETSFITFASCVKHLEVTGKQKSGVRWEIRPVYFFLSQSHPCWTLWPKEIYL